MLSGALHISTCMYVYIVCIHENNISGGARQATCTCTCTCIHSTLMDHLYLGAHSYIEAVLVVFIHAAVFLTV